MVDEGNAIVDGPGIEATPQFQNSINTKEFKEFQDKSANDGFPTNEIPELSCSEMASQTLQNYMVKALEISKLPRTQENMDKITMNLTKKFNSWLLSSDFIMQDVTKQDFATEWLEDACRARGLPNTTESWRKLIKEIR